VEGSSFSMMCHLNILVIKLRLTWINITNIVQLVIVSNTLAAELSGPNPTSFYFVGSHEKDGLQDESTYDRGTAALDYECCSYIREHLRMIQQAAYFCLE
jgi:hypothetical protein